MAFRLKRYFSIVVCGAAALVLAACNVVEQEANAKGAAAAPQASSVALAEESATTDTALLDGDLGLAQPIEVAELAFLEEQRLSPAQEELLSRNGFVVRPSDWSQFYHLYEVARYDEVPIYLTIDAVLHVYHLLFDKILRELEEERLIPAIEALTRSLEAAAKEQYQEAQGTAMEEAARRVWAYFAVAAQLISAEPEPVPAEIAGLVDGELARIQAHTGFDMSPLMSLPEAFELGLQVDPYSPPDEAALYFAEDYSQYAPRGHYTRTEERQRYFRTMMWYGRINFRLRDARETQMALLIMRLMENTSVDGAAARDIWAQVYEPTSFLVGNADDLGVEEYLALAGEVYGGLPSLQQLADEELLAQFMEEGKALPAPQINSMWVYIWEDEDEATRGFRFMGQRFVLDAYIFEQLIWRSVGILGEERWLPKGLDVFAAFGSEEAYRLLEEMGETGYENYDTQLERISAEIAELDDDTWQQNVYWGWLDVLREVTAVKDEAYPEIMRTAAWARKDLHSALGSWTELKHDTILYAKQVVAEMGNGEPPPPPPLHRIEPQPVAFAKLLALAQLTHEGLAERELLTTNVEEILDSLAEELAFFEDIATRELRGEEITADENDRIKFVGGWLEWMTMSAADPAEEDEYGAFYSNEKAAIVADVATDPNGLVLEEATGYVDEILVVTPTWEGDWQISLGGVYSYYEFVWPMDDRLTDEKWRTMLDEGEQPARPEWTQTFIALEE